MANIEAKAAETAVKDEQAKTDKEIAAGYTGGIAGLEKVIALLTGARDDLREQGVQVGEAGEARRRHQDKALYDMAQERQAVKDAQAKEDAERDARHKARETALRDAEDELLVLVGAQRDPEGKVPVLKVIRAAFDAKLAAAEKKGLAEGTAAAKKEYDAKVALDAANAKADKQIQDAKVAALTEANTKLEAENKRLLEAQNAQLGAFKDVALGSLNAAAGMTGKATDSLQQAASGAPGRTSYPSGRGNG